METRIAILGIVVKNEDNVDKVNSVLHDYSNYIIGRFGMPYRQKEVNIISIILDAPADIISALSGKIGKLSGISTTTTNAKL